MRARFPFPENAPTFKRIIAKYLHRENSRKVRELSKRIATSVVNLCTAYKFLLHRKLISECLKVKPMLEEESRFANHAELISPQQLEQLTQLKHRYERTRPDS